MRKNVASQGIPLLDKGPPYHLDGPYHSCKPLSAPSSLDYSVSSSTTSVDVVDHMLLLRPELLKFQTTPRTDDDITRLLLTDCAGNDELPGICLEKVEHELSGIFINCGSNLHSKLRSTLQT